MKLCIKPKLSFKFLSQIFFSNIFSKRNSLIIKRILTLYLLQIIHLLFGKKSWEIMTWKVWERNFRKGSISYYEWQLAHKLSEQQFYSFDEKFSFFLPSSSLEKLFKDSFVSFHSAIFYIPIEVELERRRKTKTFAYVSLSRLHIFIIRISNGLQMTRKMVAISLTLFLSLFHLSYIDSVSLLVSFFPSIVSFSLCMF